MLCRGILFSLLVFWAGFLGGVAGVLMLAVGAITIVTTAPGSLLSYVGSFAVLIGIAIAATVALTAGGPLAVIALLLGLGIYAFLGLKARTFVYRDRLQYLAALGVTAATAFLTFGTGEIEGFVVRTVLALGAYLVLWREFFGNHESLAKVGVTEKGTSWLYAAVVAFVAGEVTWVLKLLPVTAGNAATLVTLSVFIVTDILVRNREKRVVAKSVLWAITFIAGATVAVFAGTRWNLY